MNDDTAKADPFATQQMPLLATGEPTDLVTSPYEGSAGSGSGSGRLEVRCPNCRMPLEVAADTSFTDLTCTICGSHFSLVDQTQATWHAPSLSTLGRFELIERLGVGAYGTVWKARDRQLDRIVAVKVPRQIGMDAAETEFFFKEARTAAQLRHPNIVSVHEVGRDGDSVYIVSDFVRGVTLGDWLTGQQLTSREAAELCAKIAEALHHAHEQGVVHRDLKPANIMIDADGQPHLTDFGLARRDVGEVRMTMDGQVLGTPAYMSPEQAQGESHTADRRSDVYSLGVLLFQLLTGELPFRGNARMVMHQVIHDEPPSPRKFNAIISKDIETITLKCLHKEAARRYETAAALAGDLKHYLNGDAIAARPISALERAWRWCKKKPAIASLTAAAATLLITVAIVASVGYVMTSKALAEKEQSAATAEQVSKFLTDLFRSSDPIGWASGDNFEFASSDSTAANLTVRELVDRGAERISKQLADQPAVQATLLETIGGVYREMGLFRDAVRLLEEALRMQEAIVPADQLKIAAVKHNLGNTLHLIGRYDEAKRYLRSSLETRRQILGNEHLETSATLQALGLVLGSDRQFDEAEELLDDAIEIRRQLKGDNYQGVAIALAAKGAVLLAKGDVEAANPSIAEALMVFSKMKGGSFAAEAIAKYQRGILALEDERFDVSASLLKQTLDSATAVLGPAHPYVAFIASDYALAQAGLGDITSACRTSELAMEICRKSIPKDHPMVILLGRRLIELYVELRRFDDALAMSDRLLSDTEDRFGYKSVEHASALVDRAELMRSWGKHDLAVESARACYDIVLQLPEMIDAHTWQCREVLGECLLADSRPAETLALLKQSLSSDNGQYFAPSLTGIDELAILDLLGRALLAVGNHDDAEHVFQQGKRIASGGHEDQSAWAAWFETHTAQALIAKNRLVEAEQMLTASVAKLEKTKGREHRWTVQASDSLLAVRERLDKKTSPAQVDAP